MFIDIDYNKRKQEARLHLAKPNKQIIDVISEKFNDKMSIKLGNINQLDFSIPYNIEDKDGNIIQNPHIDSIKEKMLIRVTLGAYKEWYIVDSIEEDADTTETFNVTAFSLGYELKTKRISDYTEDSINATALLTNLLQNTVWKIGVVDALFDAMYRSFDSGADSNVLDCITNAGETYGALIIWDTEARTVSLKDSTQQGQFRGLIVDYGRLLNTIKRTRTTDEMVTRMYVYGASDSATNISLSIQSVNPSGQPYIENFGYFMYPFQRDTNKVVLQHSNFMSDELCQALLDQQDTINQNSSSISDLQSQLANLNTTLISQQSTLTTLQGDLKTILDQLDVAQSTNDQTTIDARKADRDSKQSQIDSQNNLIASTQQSITDKQSQLDTLQNQISMPQTFTQALLDELSLYVIESTWRDDRYINATELYNDAQAKFNELRQPKVVIDVAIDNLLNIIEEQYYWDKIILGDLIKVKYPLMNIEYMAKIIQIDYDLQNSDITLTIANTADLLSDTEKLVQLLYSSSNATTVIQNNKYKWDKVQSVQSQVDSLLSGQWNATKNEITAGVNNSVTVGGRGIIIKNPDLPNDVVIMQAGVIALSKDGGETWKTAIKPDGIVAEQLVGEVLVGDGLIITSQAGSFTLDNNGAVFDVKNFIVHAGNIDVNVVDNWQSSSQFVTDFTSDSIITPYEKQQVSHEWGRIATEYTSTIANIDGYYDSTTQATLQWVTDYQNAYSALNTYLNVTTQTDGTILLASANMTSNTLIDATTYNNNFNGYYNAKQEVDKQLSLKAYDMANTAQKNINEVQDDIVYNTELQSSNGDIFSNGNINTTLYVVVYKGKDDITSTLPNSAFIWRKTNDDGTEDTVFKTAHTNVGSSITVTKDDVNKRATFWCDIDIT